MSRQTIFCGLCNVFDLAKQITVIEIILSLITFVILIILYTTIWWVYFIFIMDLTLLKVEFFGIYLKKIRLIIASCIIRTTWTTFFGFIGIMLLIQENHQIFGWENSYLPFGILLFLFFIYGIFRTRPENLKMSRPENFVKSNKSISRKNFLAKFHFLQFQKWQKINF